jgi:hypothetical protein
MFALFGFRYHISIDQEYFRLENQESQDLDSPFGVERFQSSGFKISFLEITNFFVTFSLSVKTTQRASQALHFSFIHIENLEALHPNLRTFNDIRENLMSEALFRTN